MKLESGALLPGGPDKGILEGVGPARWADNLGKSRLLTLLGWVI